MDNSITFYKTNDFSGANKSDRSESTNGEQFYAIMFVFQMTVTLECNTTGPSCWCRVACRHCQDAALALWAAFLCGVGGVGRTVVPRNNISHILLYGRINPH